MDELNDVLEIKILRTCPLCGKRFKKLTIEFNENRPIWINSVCDCGLSLELDKTNEKISSFSDLVGKKAIDEWNEVLSK